ncbi:outer membrane protein [Helicobacter salomonis]|uniref:OMP317 n=1 Tax=Helicobacter salomonis TaxID=56878 RepID=A0A1M4NJ76_9HELI|nr:outer membrane protein [Helicobacter salomonis]SFZ72949.1 OMP317 [Helicobacter salomonis]
MRKKASFKTSVSLALGACFGLVPSLDAADVNVVNMVNSISGILGGNYSMDTSGAFNGPTNSGAGVPWGDSTIAPITAPGSTTPLSTTSPNAPFGNGTLNNPYNTANNLYGSGGLLNGYIGTLPSSLSGNPSTDQLGIYSLSAVNSLVGILRANATGAYGARTAFGGVNTNNNILDPGTSITDNYFSIARSTGQAAKVTGNLTPSQVGASYTTDQVNTLAGGVYTNITQLTSSINTLSYDLNTAGSFATYSADLSTALGNLNSLGGQFVNASTGLSSALSGLAGILNNTPGATFFTPTTAANGITSYSLVATNPSAPTPYNALNTLSAINQLNSDIAGGGIATDATTLNDNYITVMKQLGTTGLVSNLQIIANGVLNTPLSDVTNSNAASTTTAAANLNAVLTTLSDMVGKGQNAAQVKAALQGLVNPNTNYTTDNQVINNHPPKGDGYEAVYNAYSAVASNLTKLQGALGTSNLGDTLIKALEVNQLLTTIQNGMGNNTTLKTAFTANSAFSFSGTGVGQIFNAFGNTTSTNYYGTLSTLLSKLSSYLNTNGVDTATSFTSNNVANGSTVPGTTTLYPTTGPVATSTVTSWISQRVLNQSAYNKTYNAALGNLLSYAMSYNKNSTTLGSMLSSSSLLGSILTQGINNAAANVMYNSGALNSAGSNADSINNQALALNNIKAFFNSEDLLNNYVGAITQNYSSSPTSVQQAQASALDYFYNALNASTAQNGLIAQTKEAIANALNNNFLASNLPKQALQTINGMSPNLFEPSATKAQIANSLLDLNNSVFGNFKNTASAALGTLDAAKLQATLGAIQGIAGIQTALANIQSAGTAIKPDFDLNAALSEVLGTGTGAVAPDAAAQVTALPTSTNYEVNLRNKVIEGLTALVGAANASTETTSLTFGATPLGKLVTALTSAASGSVGFNVAANTAGIGTLITTMTNTTKALEKVAQGLNLGQLESMATAAATQNTIVGYVKDLPTLAREIGMATGVSARQNFLDGSLSVTDLSSQIQALKAQIASYENMGTTTNGKAGLDIGLSSLLGSSISSVQNLGFANAAVNTLTTQLQGALPLLVNGTGAGSSSFNISTVQGLVAELNKAVGTLYSGTNGNRFFNDGNMQTTSNMNNSTVTVSPNTFGLGGGGGVGANANSTTLGDLTTASNNELYNLANLNTINSLLSGGVLTSNAISAGYIGAFGAQTGSNVGFAGNIATSTSTYGGGPNVTAYTALTSNYNAGTTLTSVVNALLPIGQQLASGTIDAATALANATTALTPLISSASTNAPYVWAAYEAVMGLKSGGTNSVASLNNLLSSKQDLNTASGIAQVITDANALITANTALVTQVGGLPVGSKVLAVGVTGGAINSAANLNNAIAAATALGNLLKQINPADLARFAKPSTPTRAIPNNVGTAVNNVTTVINAINSYNHNVTLLNNLTDGKGASIAASVIKYLQGNSDYETLTGNSVGTSAINNLQNLLNRYEYLQGLQAKVNAAIANNPYALVMQENQVLKSNGYQAAARALVSTVSSPGLFNLAISGTLNPGASTTLDLNTTTFTNLATTMGNDIANAQAWNAYFSNLNTSNSILSAPASGAGTQAAIDLNNIANSIYNLAGYFSPAGVSDNKVVTTNLSSNINGTLGAYKAINTAVDYLTTTNASNLNIAANLSLGNLTTTGTGSTGNGFNSSAPIGATDNDDITFLGVAQSIVKISSMLTPVDGQTNGVVGNQTLINGVNTVMGSGAGSATTIQGTSGQMVTLFKQGAGAGLTAFDLTGPIPNTVTGINGTTVTTTGTNGAGAGVAPNANTLTTINPVSVAVVNGIVKNIEANPTLKAFLADPGTFNAGTGDANIIALQTAVKDFIGGAVQSWNGSALTGGSGNTAVLNSAAIATQFLKNLNAFVGSAGTLQALNAKFKPSVRAAVANFNSPNFGANVQTMLSNALGWVTNYDNALRAVKTGGTLGTAATGAVGTTAVYDAIASIVQNANTLFNETAASGGSDSGALATTTQALAQYALDNSLSAISPDTNSVPTAAASASSLAGLMAFYLASDMGLISNGSFADPSIDSVAYVISVASPAQLAAAATQVLASDEFKNSTDMQTNLLNTTLANMLTQSQTYTNAATGQSGKSGLSGLLNSKTSIADVLQTAIANAASMHNLKGVLNPSNGDGVSVSKGQLSTASINTINRLLSAMKAANDSLPTINPDTVAGAEAKMLLSMLTANNAATSALSLLSSTGGATSDTAQTYLQNVTTVINDQATFLSKQSSTVVQLLTGMTEAVAGSTTTDTQAQNAFGALRAVYTQIASPTINYDSAMRNLLGVITQLQDLQQVLASELAANQGQPGVNGASVEGLGPLKAIVLMMPKDRLPVTQGSLTPQQVQAVTNLLGKVQTALTYAKAAQLKMAQQLAQRNIVTTYNGAHLSPMRTSNSNGNMYGVNAQFGYKQFFGKKKRFGLRYYASFSYQHGTFMDGSTDELDNFVYGAGIDALYNFYESKDAKYTSGIFAGFMLAGSSWLVKGASSYISQMNYIKSQGGSVQMNTSYFQVPLNIGFRTNINKHNGFEIGLRIPLAVNYYFKSDLNGLRDTVAYKRNVSVFFNYVYNF